MKREWWRLVWHGYPDGFDAFLELTLVERYYDNDALNWLIDQEVSRPSDLR